MSAPAAILVLLGLWIAFRLGYRKGVVIGYAYSQRLASSEWVTSQREAAPWQ